MLKNETHARSALETATASKQRQQNPFKDSAFYFSIWKVDFAIDIGSVLFIPFKALNGKQK